MNGIDNACLAFDPAEEAPIRGLLGSSITYRIATRPREGQKVFTLQTLPAEPDAPRPEVAESWGFSLHAGIAAKASQRVALVTNCGRICYKRQKINVSTVFAGQLLGIKQVTNSVWLVSFMHYDLGFFDAETCRMEPIKDPFRPNVLPM